MININTKFIVIFFFSIIITNIYAEENLSDINFDYYDSITTSAEFNQKFFYKPVRLKTNNLFEDIKVSLIEAIPFAFLYTFAYLFISEAISQNTWQPRMKTLEDYKMAYINSAVIFSIINVTVNLWAYYKYDKEEKKYEKN